MSPVNPNQTVPSNILTAVLGAAVLIVLATTILAGIKCYIHYGTIFPMP
jgi:hypothetical protein